MEYHRLREYFESLKHASGLVCRTRRLASSSVASCGVPTTSHTIVILQIIIADSVTRGQMCDLVCDLTWYSRSVGVSWAHVTAFARTRANWHSECAILITIRVASLRHLQHADRFPYPNSFRNANTSRAGRFPFDSVTHPACRVSNTYSKLRLWYPKFHVTILLSHRFFSVFSVWRSARASNSIQTERHFQIFISILTIHFKLRFFNIL